MGIDLVLRSRKSTIMGVNKFALSGRVQISCNKIIEATLSKYYIALAFENSTSHSKTILTLLNLDEKNRRVMRAIAWIVGLDVIYYVDDQ